MYKSKYFETELIRRRDRLSYVWGNSKLRAFVANSVRYRLVFFCCGAKD